MPKILRSSDHLTHMCAFSKLLLRDGVKDLEWPAQTPDLNPTEYLWDEQDH